jgi:hypothetical protein
VQPPATTALTAEAGAVMAWSRRLDASSYRRRPANRGLWLSLPGDVSDFGHMDRTVCLQLNVF